MSLEKLIKYLTIFNIVFNIVINTLTFFGVQPNVKTDCTQHRSNIVIRETHTQDQDTE